MTARGSCVVSPVRAFSMVLATFALDYSAVWTDNSRTKAMGSFLQFAELLSKMSGWLCIFHRLSIFKWATLVGRRGGWCKARPIAINRAVTRAGHCRLMSSICHSAIQYSLWSVLRARSKTSPGWEMFRLSSAPLSCGRDQRRKRNNS